MGALINSTVDFDAEENGASAERVQGENVTPGLLETLGAQPLTGRLAAVRFLDTALHALIS